MTHLRIDHVTVAASELQRLETAFAAAGLDTVYGGRHANGVTHMSIIGFADGSYIELIAPVNPGAVAPVWNEHMRHDGGPCAWAIGVDDIAAETARLAALGVPTKGPIPASRRRPDGVVAEWDMAFLGGGQPGALLPFMISDRTPRELRVPPAVSTTHSSGAAETRPGLPETAAFDELPRGIATVILGVSDLNAAADLFRTAYGWVAPEVEDDTQFGARLAFFGGAPAAPVVLATPLSGEGWLAQRLTRFGDSPCAYVLAADDLNAAARRFRLSSPRPWRSRSVAWFDPAALNGCRLGVTAGG